MGLPTPNDDTPPLAADAPLKVAVGGFGAVGRTVAEKLDAGIPGLALAAISARRVENAERLMRSFSRPVPVLALGDLAAVADIVVECAPARNLPAVARPTLKAGKTLVTISVGALLDAHDLVQLASEHGGRIIVPSGAMLGLDAVSAAAEGTIHSVSMVTRKPIEGLRGAPYLAAKNIDLDDVREPMLLFKGSAREAAVGFPANLNVAVALALAGIGPDWTSVEIWADPTVTRNTHRVVVQSDSADLTMQIENVPSDDNPKTGRITALSVVAALRRLSAPLRVGT